MREDFETGEPRVREWVYHFSTSREAEQGAEHMKQADAILEVSKPARRKRKTNERLSMLGVPSGDMTPAVELALSALLEKLDDTTRELSRTKESLAEIERLVDVDCVAPIPNRRAFMRRLSWAITMFERYAHPSSILYFDLNNFKQINDVHGHSAGDLAIRHVAELLSHTMRESDFLARIGGDEFAVIMYYAGEEAARMRASMIVDKLKNTPFVCQGQRMIVTTAYGCYTLRKGDDAESALASADMSMYVDKRRAKEAEIEVFS